MAQTSTQQNLQTCLEFIDERLDNSSEQTIRIAEMIICDIKNLTRAYPEALRSGRLKQHSERVRLTQLNWVSRLHDIISEQSNRDLNGQVINALQGFVDNLNHIADFVSWITGQPVFDPKIYYFEKIPAIVDPFMIVWVVFGALAIAVLASVLPALRAAMLHPVEALRYE